MPGRLLTVIQAARILRRTPRTVRTWIAVGDLPAHWVGDGYRIPLVSVQALLRAAPRTGAGQAAQVMCEPRTPLDTAPSPLSYAESNGANGHQHKAHDAEELAMPIDLSQYLTLAQAAERVQRSTRTIRRWVAQGELPRALRIKQRILVAPADLDALYQSACPE